MNTPAGNLSVPPYLTSEPEAITTHGDPLLDAQDKLKASGLPRLLRRRIPAYLRHLLCLLDRLWKNPKKVDTSDWNYFYFFFRQISPHYHRSEGFIIAGAIILYAFAAYFVFNRIRFIINAWTKDTPLLKGLLAADVHIPPGAPFGILSIILIIFTVLSVSPSFRFNNRSKAFLLAGRPKDPPLLSHLLAYSNGTIHQFMTGLLQSVIYSFSSIMLLSAGAWGTLFFLYPADFLLYAAYYIVCSFCFSIFLCMGTYQIGRIEYIAMFITFFIAFFGYASEYQNIRENIFLGGVIMLFAANMAISSMFAVEDTMDPFNTVPAFLLRIQHSMMILLFAPLILAPYFLEKKFGIIVPEDFRKAIAACILCFSLGIGSTLLRSAGQPPPKLMKSLADGKRSPASVFWLHPASSGSILTILPIHVFGFALFYEACREKSDMPDSSDSIFFFTFTFLVLAAPQYLSAIIQSFVWKIKPGAKLNQARAFFLAFLSLLFCIIPTFRYIFLTLDFAFLLYGMVFMIAPVNRKIFDVKNSPVEEHLP